MSAFVDTFHVHEKHTGIAKCRQAKTATLLVHISCIWQLTAQFCFTTEQKFPCNCANLSLYAQIFGTCSTSGKWKNAGKCFRSCSWALQTDGFFPERALTAFKITPHKIRSSCLGVLVRVVGRSGIKLVENSVGYLEQ